MYMLCWNMVLQFPNYLWGYLLQLHISVVMVEAGIAGLLVLFLYNTPTATLTSDHSLCQP